MARKVATLERLSPRAFGQAIGVSRQAVQKAIRTGRLKEALTTDEATGHHRIELGRGRAEWEAWADPSKRPKGARPSGRPKAGAAGTPSMFDSASDKEAKEERKTHARASAERIEVDTELKRIELETLRGNLVDRREVQREYFRLARIVRDRLQAVPDRVAAHLASLDKPALVHEHLTQEITRALAVLERGSDGETTDDHEDAKP